MATPSKSVPSHTSMNQFAIDGDQLVVGGMPLSRLAERVGQTPFYAYDRGLLLSRVAELRAVLPDCIKIHFAMKANPMPAVVGYMSKLVDGVDIASAGELTVALNAGAKPHEISFAGPGKRESELRQAVAAGVLINVESFREIDILANISEELTLPARVAVRVNPDFELKSSGMKMGGGPKQFGIDAERVPELLTRIGEKRLTFEGFHLFSGSQSLKAESICEAQKKSYELALALSRQAPSAVSFLNLGGGFGIPYFPGEQRLDITPISNNLHQLADRAKHDFPGASLVIELGRYLVGEAGIYVSRVIDRKISRGQTFLIVDGGLHHHLSVSGNFGQVIRKNYPVAIGNRMATRDTENTTIVGPLCTPLDILAEQMTLAVAKPGDLVVVFQSGAYGATASPQRFLGHPEVVEVLV